MLSPRKNEVLDTKKEERGGGKLYCFVYIGRSYIRRIHCFAIVHVLSLLLEIIYLKRRVMKLFEILFIVSVSLMTGFIAVMFSGYGFPEVSVLFILASVLCLYSAMLEYVRYNRKKNRVTKKKVVNEYIPKI